MKCVFLFSPYILFEEFLIVRRNERDMIKTCICLHVVYLLFLRILMKPVFSLQIFEKSSSIKIDKKSITT